MAGLFDFLGAPGSDQSQALGLLAAGMMQGNFGGGLLAANQQFSPDAKMAREFKQAQMDNYKSEIAQRAAAMKRADDDQQFGMALYNGSGLPGQGGQGTPTSQAAQGGAPVSPDQLNTPMGRSWLGSLSGQQVVGLQKLGRLPAGAEKIWEIEKFGKDYKQGDFRVMPDGSNSMIPMVDKGLGYGPNGVSVLPGAAQAQATLTAANETAKAQAQAGFDPFTIPAPAGGGNPTLTTRGALVQSLQNPQPQLAPTMPQTQPGLRNQGPGTLSPELQDMILRDAKANGISNPQVNFTATGFKNPVFGLGQQAVQPNSQPPAQSAPGIALQSEAEKAAAVTGAEQRAKDVAEQRKQIMTSGFSAPSNIARYQQIGKLLQDVDGGALTPTGMHMASLANSLGLKIDKNLPNKEAAMSIANEAALQLRSPSGGAGMPGAMSDADRDFLSSMTPNMTQSAQGRKQVIDAYVSVQSRNQQIAQFARNYEKKHGTLDNGFFDQLQAWSGSNPLFGSR